MREVSLEEITTVSSGQGAPQGDSSYSFNEGTPFIKAGDMEFLTNGGSIEDIQKVERDVAAENKLTEYPKGSIVFAKSGMSAKKDRVYCLDADSYVVNHLAIIEPNNKEYLSRFLTYYLQFYKPSKLIRDEAYPSIRISDIRKLEIPLPSLSEQKAIVAKLDRAQRLIDIDKEMLAKYDELIQCVFLEMFGDPVTVSIEDDNTFKLDELVDFKGGGTPSKKNNDFWGGHIPWVSPKDMKWTFINNSQDKITSAAIEESSTKLIKSGAVLSVVRSGILKNTWPLAINTVDVTLNQDMKALLCSERINNYFLLYYLKNYSRKILGTVRGTTADNISTKVFKNILIKLPDLEKQLEFMRIVKAIIKEKKATKIKKSEELFSSLVQGAFG